MRVLCYDASTHAGWGLLEGELGCEKPAIIESGLIENDKPILAFGPYPWCYVDAAEAIATRLFELAVRFRPDMIVIEETNKGKNRYTQKILEFIHSAVLRLHRPLGIPIRYISSGEWRRAAGVTMSKDDKRNNSRLSRAKKLAQDQGVSVAEAKKSVGVKGRIGKKHVSVRYINDLYGLDLRVKDNDVAEAVCLGVAFFRGAQFADGTF